ncbi:hypothetical protein P7C70_g4103, partial [Phenoliferia sp. Uapishka_3]
SPDSASHANNRKSGLPSRPPSPHFVALCFGHLRRCSPLPILYTVRTATQGGKFPDPYDDPILLKEYVALVELGFKLGAEYVDLELGLSDETISRLVAMRGAATQCLVADHDRHGKWIWGSQPVMDKYLRAVSLGADIVKLVSFPSAFTANLELLKFRQKVEALQLGRRVPLLAVNLGKPGQLSRFLNPVFTPVTHPLLPGVAAPGQLTFAQTQHALYLSGLILEKTFFVPTVSVAERFTHVAETLGLPFTFIVEDRLLVRDVEKDFGGAFLGAQAISTLPIEDKGDDFVLSPAKNSGWADVVVPASTEPDSYDVPPTALEWYKHTNVRVLALAEIISQNLSPINAVGTHTSALLVGLNKKDLAEVLEALSIVGARWVSLLSCEEAQHASLTSTLNGALSPPPASHHPSSAPGSRLPSRASSRAGTPSAPYPQPPILTTTLIDSFSSPKLYSHRPPTIIIASDGSPAIPESLFASPTGGAALDLSSGKGELRVVVEGKGGGGGNREGWMLLGPKEVQAEVERQAFRALTGRRLG